MADDKPTYDEYMDMPAPHGRFKNGKPRANPPGKAGAATSKANAKIDYRSGVQGLLEAVAFPVAFANAKDAELIVEHAPPIASAIDDVAHKNPGFARVLDKILTTGMYGALFMAVAPLAIGIASNHGLIPTAKIKPLRPQTPQEIADAARKANPDVSDKDLAQMAREAGAPQVADILWSETGKENAAQFA